MSAIPQELRDAVVRQLEAALDESGRKISRSEQQVSSLRRAIGETEGVQQQQQQMLRRLESEVLAAGAELDRERTQARLRLVQLQQRAEEQRRQLDTALREAERRQRREWEDLRQQIGQLAHDREARERRLRQAAGQAAERAAQLRARLEPGEVERLDLQGSLAAAEIQLAGARGLATDPQVPSAEALTAAYGAEEALRQVEATIESRAATLAALSSRFVGDAAWLQALLRGDAMLGMPGQAEELKLLLRPEQAMMGELVERQLAAAAAGLQRWNGHGALVARLSAVRDLLGAEVLAARRALDAAVAHESARYDLGHIWEELELRFGAIRERGADTPGAWANAADRKSTYFYFLETQRGEIRVEVPWDSDIAVHHQGRLAQRYSPALEPDADVRFAGGLGRRWRELAARLDNPSWTPDEQPDGGAR